MYRCFTYRFAPWRRDMIGARLRDRRIEMGLSIGDLSAKAKISAHHLRDVETARRLPGVKTLLSLTDLLRLPTADWLDLYLAGESRLLSLIHLAEHLVQVRDLGGASLVLGRLRTLSREDHRYQGQIYHLRGLLAYYEGRHARALHWFRLAETSAVKSLNAAKRADALYNTALAMAHTGLLSQSAAKFDEAATAFQSLGDMRKAGYSYLSKANVLSQMQSYREALPIYRRASSDLRGDPWCFESKLGEVICRWRIRSSESALRLLTSIGRLADNSDRMARYHHNLGVICRQIGRLDDAMAHLAIALETSTSDPPHRPEFLPKCVSAELWPVMFPAL